MEVKFVRDYTKSLMDDFSWTIYTAKYKIVNGDTETWAQIDDVPSHSYYDHCDVDVTLDHELIGDGVVTELRLCADQQSGGYTVCGVEGMNIRRPNDTDDIILRMRIKVKANTYDYSL